jgi:hypothetical protein
VIPFPARRLVLAAMVLALAGAAAGASSADAARVGSFNVHLVVWQLSIDYAPYVETKGPAGGKLGYCASVGDQGLTVQFAWNGASRGQTFSFVLRGPRGASVFRRGRFTTIPWSTSGFAFVPFQSPRHGTSAPKGRYRFRFVSDGRTLINSALRLVANSC